MATLSPFTGWLATPETAPALVAPADDLLPPAARARGRTSAFVRTAGPAYHVLELTQPGHRQVGIVGTVPVDDLGGTVRPHEGTRADREAALLDHLQRMGAQSSPLGLIHPGTSPVAELLDATTGREPRLDVTVADGLRQRVWTVDRPEEVATVRAAVAAMPALYLTDGHHRAAAARRFAAQRRQEAAGGTAPGPDPDRSPWDHVLVALFPASELRLYAYHRVVADLAGRDPVWLRRSLAERFAAVPATDDELRQLPSGQVGVRVAGDWLRLTLPRPPTDDPVATLDVSVLQDVVLGPLLGIDDPRTDRRLAFVPATRGLDALAHRVGDAGVAFVLPPLQVAQLLAVADAGAVMPPKSTWVEPKLRSGLFLRAVVPTAGWDAPRPMR